MDERRPDAIVLEAGVIGLTTRACLAEHGLRVQIRTRVAPSATTSAVASAMIGPSFAPADDPVGVRERVGIEEFTALATVENTGVTLRRGRAGEPTGRSATAPRETVRTRRATGGRIELAEVNSLTELAEQAPLVANCAGLGARELVPDPSVRRCAANRSFSTIRESRSSSAKPVRTSVDGVLALPRPRRARRHPGRGRREPGTDLRRRRGDPAPLRRRRTAAAAGAGARAPGGTTPRAAERATGARPFRQRPVRAQLRARRQRGDPVLGLRTRGGRAAHRSGIAMSRNRSGRTPFRPGRHRSVER